MNHHILLIDDDEEEIEFFREAIVIMENPIAFSFANSCADALNKLKNFDPTLIFIDYNMPGICGVECLIEIIKMKPGKNCKTILYSNALTTKLITEANESGATYCLKKPTDLQTLTRLLESFDGIADGPPEEFVIELEKNRRSE